MLKKNLTPLYGGEKKCVNTRGLGENYYLKITHTSLPHTSNGHVSHLEGRGGNGFDTSVNVIHQQNVWHAFI